MTYLKEKYRAECIYFREDNFTLDSKRISELCDLITTEKLDIAWMCETRADSLQDPSIVSLMAKAGCKVFYIGVESGSQRMLDFMRKGETVQQFIKAFDNSRKAGIKTYASLVYGLPTETEKDIDLTESLIERIRPDFVGRNVFIGLPGSQVYDYVRANRLYEYEDDTGILYLEGHNDRVDRFYNGNPHRKVPGTGSLLKRCGHFRVLERAWKACDKLIRGPARNALRRPWKN